MSEKQINGDDPLAHSKEEALRKRDFEGYLCCFASERYMEPFIWLLKHYRLTDEEYWRVVKHVWIGSEVIAPNLRLWKKLLTDRRNRREKLLMNSSEWEKLQSLPDTLTVFRGCLWPKGRNGLSWSLQKNCAKFFSEYSQSPRRNYFAPGLTRGVPAIVQGFCDKRNVIAYFNGRDENEIVILPEHVKSKTIVD